MSFFDRLLGKKPTIKEVVTPETAEQNEFRTCASSSVDPPKVTAPNQNQLHPKQSVTAPKPELANSPWRTFSIFISSTFADMQAERDYLKIYVFPRVAEELRKKRISLEIVDLRWGVDTVSVNEEEREATVLKVCLDEIRRCKPFFIGLLGDRYGWVPSEERMLTASFGQKLILPAKNKSVTALEMEFGVLASTEQLTRSVFYLRKRLPYDDFTNEKAALYCDDFDPKLSAIEKRERNTGLTALKDAISTYYSNSNQSSKVKPYAVSWDKKKQQVIGLESWGEQVLTDILTECAGHAADTWDLTPKNPHEEQLALLDAFIESHTHVTIITTPNGEEKVETFCGREKLLSELNLFLLSSVESKTGIVLTGESGSGKSAIFSMVYKMMERSNCLLLAHSAGISPDAQSIAGLLRSWNKQLSFFLQIPDEPESIPDSIEPSLNLEPQRLEQQKTGIDKLQKRFAGLLSKATEKTKVVMLVDALDRFEPTERAKYITWLPKVLPLNVRVLITAITGTEKKAVEFHEKFETKNLDQFTQEEAKGMLNSLCKRHHKSLSPTIEKLILSMRRTDGLQATSSPLWLSLAVNILMAIDADDFEMMSSRKGSGGDQIESYLQEMAEKFPTMPGELFLQLIDRASRIFGLGFTQTIFNAIAFSRSGLRESDLASLIQAILGENWDTLQFANLRRWFSAHLIETGDGHLWNLAHSILRNTLRDEVATENFKSLYHSIATHLLSLPPTDTLRISETMFHLMQADDKRAAIGYYVSELDDEASLAATKVLAETIILDESGLKVVAALPELVADDKEIFPKILSRYTYKLNDFLGVEGNLTHRQTLLTKLAETVGRNDINEFLTWVFVYDKGSLYSLLGEINRDMGYMEEALNYFVLFNKLSKELYDGNFLNESLKKNLVISYQYLGEIYQIMGQMEEALKYYMLFNKLIKEFYNANPQNESLKKGLAISYQFLGKIQQDMGHVEEALYYYVLYNKLSKELYSANLQNESFKNSLAISYQYLGMIQQNMGHIEEALNYYVLYNKLSKEIYDANPQNESFKNSLANSYEKLGDIHQNMGHMDEVLNFFMLLNKLSKELYDASPQNESLKKGLAISYFKLGDIYKDMGNIEEALNYFVLYNKLGKEIYNANPQNESNKKSLATSYGTLGRIYQKMGKIEEALNYFVLCNKLSKELYETNPQNESIKESLATSYQFLGMIEQARSHKEDAINYFVLSNKLSKELYDANPQRIALLEALGVSYYKLAMIYLIVRNVKAGKECFEEWKKIISFLSKNFPQVAKYKEWDRVKYI